MKYIDCVLGYKLYEVDEKDTEITGAAGNHYCRSTVLIFRDICSKPTIGEECGWAKSEEEARQHAEEFYLGTLKEPIKIVFEKARKASVITQQQILEHKREVQFGAGGTSE